MSSYEKKMSLKMSVKRVVILLTLVLERLASPNDLPDLPRKQEVGKRQNSPDIGRITGGEAIDDIKQYGFMASVQATRINGDHKEPILCAGFVLTEYIFGTAAYCVYTIDPSQIDVRVGSNRISTAKTVPIDDVIISHKYNPNRPEKGGNLALLYAEDDIPISSDVYPINYLVNLFKLPEEGSMVTVLGWGLTQPGDESSMSDQLMKVEIPIISSNQCAVSYFFSVANNEFCAGTILGGDGPCEGDIGGPALHEDILVGVVSGGRGCGAPVSPSIFTDITHRDSNKFIKLNTDIWENSRTYFQLIYDTIVPNNN